MLRAYFWLFMGGWEEEITPRGAKDAKDQTPARLMQTKCPPACTMTLAPALLLEAVSLPVGVIVELSEIPLQSRLLSFLLLSFI